MFFKTSLAELSCSATSVEGVQGSSVVQKSDSEEGKGSARGPTAPGDLFLTLLAQEMGRPEAVVKEQFKEELRQNGSLMRSWRQINRMLRDTASSQGSVPTDSLQLLARSMANIWKDTRKEASDSRSQT